MVVVALVVWRGNSKIVGMRVVVGVMGGGWGLLSRRVMLAWAPTGPHAMQQKPMYVLNQRKKDGLLHGAQPCKKKGGISLDTQKTHTGVSF